MRTLFRRCLPAPILAVVLIGGCHDDATAPDSTAASAKFAGSRKCASCHGEIHARWQESGHPYALAAVDGAAPVSAYGRLAAYPADPVDPPFPYFWPYISYVAGGYGWKMLWINSRGYPVMTVTSGDRVMYSFADRQWVYWGSYAQARDPADCGRCHATGWVPDEDWDTDDDLSDNQDGLEGMAGRWTAPGIHCEECHGWGSLHAVRPSRFELVVDRSSADCGRCHTKDPRHDPLASGGFVTPNSQYDEWLHSGHALGESVVECVDCHDPHASVKYDDLALGLGTHTACVRCHPAAASVNRHDRFAPTACVDCHMPFAVHSAAKYQSYGADMRTHLVDIAVAAVGRRQGMGMTDGIANIRQDAGGRARITLDLACYGCHRDPGGEGGEARALSLTELADFAPGMHRPGRSAAGGD